MTPQDSIQEQSQEASRMNCASRNPKLNNVDANSNKRRLRWWWFQCLPMWTQEWLAVNMVGQIQRKAGNAIKSRQKPPQPCIRVRQVHTPWSPSLSACTTTIVERIQSRAVYLLRRSHPSVSLQSGKLIPKRVTLAKLRHYLWTYISQKEVCIYMVDSVGFRYNGGVGEGSTIHPSFIIHSCKRIIYRLCISRFWRESCSPMPVQMRAL